MKADGVTMDLSKLLGDLYESDDAHDTPAGHQGRDNAPPGNGPEWSDEARLDEAFASWKPGPPDDAPAAEREMATVEPATAFPQLEAALADTDQWSGVGPGQPATVDAGVLPSEVGTGAGEPLEAAAPKTWARSDDDVLPRRRSGRSGLRLSLLRR